VNKKVLLSNTERL